MIDSSLLALLACPQCHGPLNQEVPSDLPSLPDSALTCPACRLAFPIENGLPILLIDKAIPIASAHSSGDTCGDTSTDSFGTPNHLKQE